MFHLLQRFQVRAQLQEMESLEILAEKCIRNVFLSGPSGDANTLSIY